MAIPALKPNWKLHKCLWNSCLVDVLHVPIDILEHTHLNLPLHFHSWFMCTITTCTDRYKYWTAVWLWTRLFGVRPRHFEGRRLLLLWRQPIYPHHIQVCRLYIYYIYVYLYSCLIQWQLSWNVRIKDTKMVSDCQQAVPFTLCLDHLVYKAAKNITANY